MEVCITKQELPTAYPSFYSLAFSAETFFPIPGIDGVKKNWEIITEYSDQSIKPFGLFMYCYSWFHKIIGWLVSTLIIGGYTAYFIRK
jgi:hypothetical protein